MEMMIQKIMSFLSFTRVTTPLFQSISYKHFSPEVLHVRNKTMPLTKTYTPVSFYTITKCYGKAALMARRKSASIFQNFGGKKIKLKNPARIALHFFKSHKIKKICSY